MDLNKIAESYLAVTDEVFGRMAEDIETTSQLIAESLRSGGKVLVCGNGGSAGDAQHMVGELVNRFLIERKPYAGIALTTDTSVMTAISNDYSYEEVFQKQVEALGRKGDVLIGISTSGNAKNVLNAINVGKAQGLVTIGLTGGEGGELAHACEHLLCVSSSASTPRIQEGHGLIIHLLCERVEEILK